MNLMYLTLTQVTILSGVPHLDPGDCESNAPDLDPGDYTIWCASP
jgi:hypothetical protein